MPKSTTGKMPFWVMRHDYPVARCSDIGPALHLLAECGTHISIGRVHSSAHPVSASPQWKEWACAMHDLMETIESEVAKLARYYRCLCRDRKGKSSREISKETAAANYLEGVLRDKLGLWDAPGWREHGERRPEEVAVP